MCKSHVNSVSTAVYTPLIVVSAAAALDQDLCLFVTDYKYSLTIIKSIIVQQIVLLFSQLLICIITLQSVEVLS